MRKPTIGALAFLSLMSVSLPGCALLPHHHWGWAKIKPTPVPIPAAAPQVMVDDGVYADAVTAVSHRDYASALDLLQAARARNPNDPRVLNAFGVVYDKLGRFDLSSRYYAQAEALDPGSPIVANNRAYSRLMQSKGASATPAVAFAQAGAVPQPHTAPARLVTAPFVSARVAGALVGADPAGRPDVAKPVGAEYALATAGADVVVGKVGTP
jgi:hypothetical protein